MALNSEESKALKRLLEKQKQPDAPPSQRVLNVSIDLGDDKQVERAQKFGLLDFLTGGDDGDDDGDGDGGDGDGGGDGGDGDGDDTPRRKGYFGG